MEGKRHLGAALGSRLFTEQYVSEKVESWSRCVSKFIIRQCLFVRSRTNISVLFVRSRTNSFVLFVRHSVQILSCLYTGQAAQLIATQGAESVW